VRAVDFAADGRALAGGLLASADRQDAPTAQNRISCQDHNSNARLGSRTTPI